MEICSALGASLGILPDGDRECHKNPVPVPVRVVFLSGASFWVSLRLGRNYVTNTVPGTRYVQLNLGIFKGAH